MPAVDYNSSALIIKAQIKLIEATQDLIDASMTSHSMVRDEVRDIVSTDMVNVGERLMRLIKNHLKAEV